MYEVLPKSPTDINESQPDTSKVKKQGALDKTINILNYYAQIRKFLVEVLNKREDLVSEVNYISSKINAM